LRSDFGNQKSIVGNIGCPNRGRSYEQEDEKNMEMKFNLFFAI
jgi:hypothetical protein